MLFWGSRLLVPSGRINLVRYGHPQCRMQPETRYAKSEDVQVDYQVFGFGAVNLVFVPGFISNVEHYWLDPSNARWLKRLARFARVISFDKRGTGLSIA